MTYPKWNERFAGISNHRSTRSEQYFENEIYTEDGSRYVDYCYIKGRIKYNPSGLNYNTTAGINKIETISEVQIEYGGSRPLDYLTLNRPWEDINITDLISVRGGCIHGGQVSQITQRPWFDQYGISHLNITEPITGSIWKGSRLNT